MREITTEIRTVYYRNPELFKSRDKVSAAIDDLCCMIGCTRSSLHVYASEKGIVFGNISFSVGNQRYNCTTGGIKGTPIPSKTDKIKSMKNKDALFILVVKKETVFQRLVEDGFCRKYRCILITAKGMPDVASRFFLRKMWSEFQLPVFALVDFDPYGLKILSVFRNGSKNMSFDSENLTTPDIKLIGMLHKDIERYQIREDLKLKMTDFDIKTAKSLLKKPYISEEEKEGLRYMLDNGIKCEVEAWYSHGIEFLSKVVLPLKIQSMVVPGQPSA
ncbi:putative DNA topoisomerase (ATP-hydrolyzing) [Rosa chinensis]|uniref:DNA topoisomerase (ATP-hydrolyzing) n=1 Tax=Rosa chinensis TaxID=74649 RepID=A0A2P6Q4H5_ROSCH|nr:DNA topoisomerase 6 subunit A3 [Rosa chinensis]PRQ29088.1 putative DNA topoisomerase (ATP-hydrolyzing) [Rosa chinensis]